MRGEHGHAPEVGDKFEGSSPHARGARPCTILVSNLIRIIPACAGSTKPEARSFFSWGDHPRMRGEHATSRLHPRTVVGSSPHARGAHFESYAATASSRIIPACAGSTKALPSFWTSCPDHPRMRGEHLSILWQTPGSPGSSPHARGARVHGFNNAIRRGIIPACAGSTSINSVSKSTARDHPRMRGEHKKGNTKMSVTPGSSPHARGAPTKPPSPAETMRIIPACAGSTLNG